jgi:hypothetical protein
MPRRATLGLCALVCVLLGAMLGVSATVFAVPADPSVHACVANNTGATRIVSASTHCYANEHALIWNLSGPPGPIGPQGAQGIPGPSGPAGANGTDGTDADPAALDSRYVNVDEADSVTNAMLSDGTIVADDLSGGAVTTSKQTANAVMATAVILIPLPPGQSIIVPSAILTIPTSESHLVAIDADVTLTDAGEAATATVVLLDNGVALDDTLQTVTLPNAARLPVHLSALVDANGGAHIYRLRIDNISPVQSLNAVLIDGAKLRAIDLGRSS